LWGSNPVFEGFSGERWYGVGIMGHVYSFQDELFEAGRSGVRRQEGRSKKLPKASTIIAVIEEFLRRPILLFCALEIHPNKTICKKVVEDRFCASLSQFRFICNIDTLT
jgi:hypothetical protein